MMAREQRWTYRIPIPLPPRFIQAKSDTIDGFERFRRLPEPLFAIFDFKVQFQIGDFKEDFSSFQLQHS